VIDLAGSAFAPDFVLSREMGERVYLEVLGFWTPQSLKRRLEEFAHAGVGNFILAAWDDLRGSRDPLTTVPPNVINYKRTLDPSAVALKADELTLKAG
jgi:uncharacterized protein